MDSINSNLRLVKSTVVERNATYSEGLAILGELIEHGNTTVRKEDCTVFLIDLVV